MKPFTNGISNYMLIKIFRISLLPVIFIGCSADPSGGVYTVSVNNATDVNLAISYENEVGPGPVPDAQIVAKHSSLTISMIGELKVNYGKGFSFNPDCGVFSCVIDLDSNDLGMK
jgi:hypothetical protein